MSTINQTPVSPRIADLLSELTAGSSQALDGFWNDVAVLGTPLIEPDGEDDTSRLVTFVWRANADLDNVVLISEHLNGWWWNGFVSSKLDHVRGTNLWFRTFRIRADARFVYRIAPNHSLIHPDLVEDWQAYRAPQRSDPFNPRQFVYPRDDERPDSTEDVWSVVDLSAAPPQPYVAPRRGVPAGQVELHRHESSTHPEARRVWVYLPPGYSQQQLPYSCIVLLDGWYYTAAIPTATILDNLIAEARIPPCIAVMIDTSQNRNRDLNGHPPFNDFLCDELVPWVRRSYNITTDPARTIVGGLSLGGVAAAFAALEHSDLFGNVLCQSGAFWNGKAGIADEEWLTHEFSQRDPVPVRFYLEAGLLENQRDAPSITILRATRHLRTVLEAKGYAVSYSEYNGGHQAISWRGSLANGLIALTR